MVIRIKHSTIIWFMWPIVAGVILGIAFAFFVPDSPPVEPVEETTERFLDLTDEAMRIYGFDQGEIVIIFPKQMVTIDGVHYIYTHRPITGLGTEKLYCIKESSWLYYTIYFMPEGEDLPGVQKKYFNF